MIVSKVPSDSLSAEEMRALDVAARYAVLNDLYGEIKRLGDVKIAAIDAHASARILAARSPEPQHKARVIESKRDVDVVAAAIAARKMQVSILQSLLRSGI